MNTIRISLLTATMIAALPVTAADSRAGTVLVTARRSSQTVDETLATVSVITREEIERSQAPDLIELLRLQPGIDLARTGGVGQSTALFLRGSNSNHTLVLIDGVRVSPLLSGAYDYANLPIAQIERIEIVRGPQAAYWGSEAIGGVIQIFTRQPENWSLRAGGGSHGTLTANAAAALRGEHGVLSFNVGRNQTDGISAQNEDGFSYDPDLDGYQSNHASLRAEMDIGKQKLALTALRTDAEIEFDDGVTESEDVTVGLNLSGNLSDHWSHRLAVGSASDRLETAAFFAIFDSRRRTLDWQNQFALDADSVLQAGINYAQEHGRDIATFDNSANIDQRRRNGAVHLGYSRNIGRHDVEIALRHDDNSEFGGDNSVQGAWGWRFTEWARLLVNYGEGFRAPNLNEQYSPGYGGLFAGNPNLQPEHSRSIEAGVKFDLGQGHTAQLQVFSTRIRDLISFTGGNDFRAENIARADIDGIELSHDFDRGGWHLRNAITVQNAENADTGNDLLRRPGRKWASSADYRFQNSVSLGGDFLLASGRKDFGTNLPGYGVMNLRAAFAFNPVWRIEARLENAFDKRYELAHGYNTLDRSAVIAIVASD